MRIFVIKNHKKPEYSNYKFEKKFVHKQRGIVMDNQVTGTLIWYYYICKREVWLMAHNLVPDQEEENVKIGKLIGETSYSRDKKEIDLGNAKIDLIRNEDGQLIVGEVKKTSRFIESASKQLLFYLLQLKEMGIEAKGELMVPEEKHKYEVVLTPENESELKGVINDIERIIAEDCPPPATKMKYCRNCAYNEFCWS